MLIRNFFVVLFLASRITKNKFSFLWIIMMKYSQVTTICAIFIKYFSSALNGSNNVVRNFECTIKRYWHLNRWFYDALKNLFSNKSWRLTSCHCCFINNQTFFFYSAQSFSKKWKNHIFIMLKTSRFRSGFTLKNREYRPGSVLLVSNKLFESIIFLKYFLNIEI